MLLGHDRIVDSGLCRPMTAVARGAAIYAASLDGELGDVRVPVIEGEVGYPADSDRAFPLADIEVELTAREQDVRRNKIEIKFRYNERRRPIPAGSGAPEHPSAPEATSLACGSVDAADR